MYLDIFTRNSGDPIRFCVNTPINYSTHLSEFSKGQADEEFRQASGARKVLYMVDIISSVLIQLF